MSLHTQVSPWAVTSAMDETWSCDLSVQHEEMGGVTAHVQITDERMSQYPEPPCSPPQHTHGVASVQTEMMEVMENACEQPQGLNRAPG